MVEPVSTAAAASAAAKATAAGANAVANAASTAAATTGNGILHVLGTPFRWVFSLPAKIVGAISGATQGVMGSLLSGATITGALTGLTLLFPEGRRAVDVAIGGEAQAQRTAERIKHEGIAGVVLDSAKVGFGTAAGVGALRGALEDGGLLVGGGLVAAVGALAYGALSAPATPAAPAKPVEKTTKTL